MKVYKCIPLKQSVGFPLRKILLKTPWHGSKESTCQPHLAFLQIIHSEQFHYHFTDGIGCRKQP
jgi:hypothetical protein